jgi:pimeloyl-ACP methyl ester carboxylesterase
MKAFLILFGTLFIFAGAAASPSIDTAYAVEIGGIRQWIQLKGEDSNRPLLLWLHGGPGVSEMERGDQFTNLLRQHYVVVQWDQRESGKTAELNHSPDLSLARINQDVYEVSQYPLRRYHKKNLVLVGNSWGGYLALQAANNHPEIIAACILVSPTISGNESERVSLQWVSAEAKKRTTGPL